MDICPTILDYLGRQFPKCDGISLKTFVEEKPFEHDIISYSKGNSTPNYMLRNGDLKLKIADKKDNSGVDALYNLKTDPLEMDNLLGSPDLSEINRKQANDMKEKLVKWMERHEPQKVDGVKNRKLY